MGPPQNVVYVVLGPTEYKGVPINKAWIRNNLELDKDGSALVYKKDVHFSRWLGGLVKKKGDTFDLTSYMLLKFETSDTEFHPEPLFGNAELQQQFREARMADTELRQVKRDALSDNVTNSGLLSFLDIKLLLNAFDEYAGGKLPWPNFWAQWSERISKDQIIGSYGADPNDAKRMTKEEFVNAVTSILEPTRLKSWTSQFAALGSEDRHLAQNALEMTRAAPIKVEVVIKDKEKGYEVKGLTVPGETTTIVVRNEDSVTHGFTSTLFKAIPVEMKGDGIEVRGKHLKSFHLEPGKTMTLIFTVPPKGDYENMRYVVFDDLYPEFRGELFIVETSGELGGG